MIISNCYFDWLNSIPSDWEIEKVKNHFYFSDVQTSNYKDFPVLSLTMSGIKERNIENNKGQIPESYEKYNLVDPLCLVFNPMDLISGWVDIPKKMGLISPSYRTIKSISREINIDFAKYYFQSLYKEKVLYYFGEGVHYEYRWALGKETLRNFPIPKPPLNQQNQIVTYLKKKTNKIDALITKTKEKLGLLIQQKNALINDAVTKGINPNIKLKETGVKWIEKIPCHWRISRFKFDSSIPIQYGINISSEKYVEKGIRFLRITDINDYGNLNKIEGKFLSEEDVPKEFLLNKYDVLFCRSGGTVGKSYLHQSEGSFSYGGYLVRLNFKTYTEAKFIFYISKARFYWDWIKLNTVVSTIKNVNGEKYKNFIYPKPDFMEQKKIVIFLDKKTKLIDKLILNEEKRIQNFKDYKKVIISELVTGKRIIST